MAPVASSTASTDQSGRKLADVSCSCHMSGVVPA